jgi:Tat protein secretion system quality control protein TatD with DNase activity
VVRKVGLDRLVLETDHEDAALVADSMAEGIRFLAEALGESETVIVERTTRNAFDLYNLSTTAENDER